MIFCNLGYNRTKMGGQTKSFDLTSDSQSVVSVSDTYQFVFRIKIINIKTVIGLNLSRGFKGLKILQGFKFFKGTVFCILRVWYILNVNN